MYLKELFKKSIANKTLDKNAFIKMCNNLNIPINKKQKGWFKRAFYELVEVLKEIDIITFIEKVICITTLGDKQKEILKGIVAHPFSIILAGKGSGKDFIVSLIFNFMITKVSLKELPYPRVNFVNIAPNQDTANKVFFKEFKHWFKQCLLWKAIGYDDEGERVPKAPIKITKTTVSVGEGIELISGHSHSTSFEGGNIYCAVIDEASDENFYNAERLTYQIKSSMKTRFGNSGKVVVITWTRFPTPNALDDVGFKLYSENQGITGVFTFKGKIWEINPFREKEDSADDYERNPILAKKMYECEPPEMDAYFIDKNKLDSCFGAPKPLFKLSSYYGDGKVSLQFYPLHQKFTKEVYCHIDLSIKHDSTGIALGYCDDKIIVSDIIELQPTRGHIVDYHSIEKFVKFLKDNYDAHISFDPYNSELLAQKYDCEVISFAMPNQVKMWKEFQKLVENEEVIIKENDKLKLQILQHQLDENKIIYHGEGSPDIADAVVPVVYNMAKFKTKSVDWKEFEDFFIEDDYEIIHAKSIL